MRTFQEEESTNIFPNIFLYPFKNINCNVVLTNYRYLPVDFFILVISIAHIIHTVYTQYTLIIHTVFGYFITVSLIILILYIQGTAMFFRLFTLP
jgi:hypothetical protein